MIQRTIIEPFKIKMVEKSYCGRRVWLLRKILLQFSIVFENLSQFVVEFSMPNVQKLN